MIHGPWSMIQHMIQHIWSMTLDPWPQDPWPDNRSNSVTHHTLYLRCQISELLHLIFLILASDIQRIILVEAIGITRLPKDISSAISTPPSTAQHSPWKYTKLSDDLLVESTLGTLLHAQAAHVAIESAEDVGHFCAEVVRRDERILSLQIRFFVDSRATGVVTAGRAPMMGAVTRVRICMITFTPFDCRRNSLEKTAWRDWNRDSSAVVRRRVEDGLSDSLGGAGWVRLDDLNDGRSNGEGRSECDGEHDGERGETHIGGGNKWGLY